MSLIPLLENLENFDLDFDFLLDVDRMKEIFLLNNNKVSIREEIF